jgi:hypothetical protein
MRALAVFPVRQCSLFLAAPSILKPPSALKNRSIHREHALATLGSSLVIPRSDRVSSIQFVEIYFGL